MQIKKEMQIFYTQNVLCKVTKKKCFSSTFLPILDKWVGLLVYF